MKQIRACSELNSFTNIQAPDLVYTGCYRLADSGASAGMTATAGPVERG
jgi:hypothetical protein